ncbi:hypothetical protein BGY98DRAFT_1096297 [Russula aff. rugulosa BPL654]|nr:hypothetical protein BGY98DRAFT_1096297 [Russula aff. rugulosa BPL654]
MASYKAMLSRIDLLSVLITLPIASASVPTSTLSESQQLNLHRANLLGGGTAGLVVANRHLRLRTHWHPRSVSVSSKLVNISPTTYSSIFRLLGIFSVMPKRKSLWKIFCDQTAWSGSAVHVQITTFGGSTLRNGDEWTFEELLPFFTRSENRTAPSVFTLALFALTSA